MTIGIDVSMLNYRGSGVANYTYNLVKNLLIYDKKNKYKLFYSSLRRPKNFYYLKEFRKLGAEVYDFKLPISFFELVWGKLHIIPVEWLIGKVDLFFSSDFFRPPLLKGTRSITTIHDLTWKIYPQYHTERVIKAHEKKLARTMICGQNIIVDSENTKRDLLKFYPGVEKRMNIYEIPLGISEDYKIIKDEKKIKRILKKYGLAYPKNYLLYVGAIEPRKNLEKSIQVFNELIKDKKYQDYKFLIVGRAGWKNQKVFKLVEKLHLKDKVIFVGFVEDKDLVYFYNACNVFIYLSKYEGFGLPPLEAAACGKPTLLYANSSLKEIFKEGYPYTKSGEELKMLKRLTTKNINMKKYVYGFAWKRYIKKFLEKIDLRK